MAHGAGQTVDSGSLPERIAKEESVVKQTTWWEEKLVYRAAKLEIDNSIIQNDSTLHKYYQEHEKDYLDEKGDIRPFAEVKEDVTAMRLHIKRQANFFIKS